MNSGQCGRFSPSRKDVFVWANESGSRVDVLMWTDESELRSVW